MTIGIILAGGRSRRFKQDKALFYDPYFEQTWVELAAEKIHQLTSTVFISVNQTNAQPIQTLFADKPYQIVIDRLTDVGPLGGLLAVAETSGETDFLLLAVDYPELSVKSLQQLAAFPNRYAVDSQDQPHFTVAHLQVDSQKLAAYLNTGNRRLKFFYQQLGATPLELPTAELENHNYH